MIYPKYVISVYPLLSSKEGFSRFIYHPPSTQLYLHLLVNVLRNIPYRDNEKFTVLIYRLYEMEDGRISDIPHSTPNCCSPTWGIQNKSRRKIIEYCIKTQKIDSSDCDNHSDNDSDNDSDSDNENDDIDVDQEQFRDLISLDILEWEDESPETIEMKKKEMDEMEAAFESLNKEDSNSRSFDPNIDYKMVQETKTLLQKWNQ